MTTNKAQILNPHILINPSKKLKQYIANIKVDGTLPGGISNIVFKNKVKHEDKKPVDIPYLTSTADRHFIKSIKLDCKDFFTELPLKDTPSSSSDKLLLLQDLHWLYEYIQKENKENDEKVYLHELLEGSDIILPKNQQIPRSEALEKRCKRLKAELENKSYHEMTKNVDNMKKRYPEDTIGYQLRQMNKNLLAIFQFILSVAAGFAFGFIGVELIIGSLDFGFRLLLGIICALTIALAELYFLAKKLNEDLQFEYIIEQQHKNVKLD